MHIQRKGSKDKPLSTSQEQRNRRMPSRVPSLSVSCWLATDGRKGIALHRLGTRQVAPELESRSLLPAPSFLPEGGPGGGVLTPKVRPQR